MRAPFARAAIALAMTVIAVGAAATPAAAHGADAPDATNYRTTMSSVTPATPGITVTVIEAGARLQLVSTTDRTVEILGYDGEPYLEVRPDGVYENVNSPAVYINANLAGGVEPPATASPAAAPAWRKISGERVARWHDRRAHWASPTPPTAVAAEPAEPHLISEWIVPLRVDLSMIEIRGTLSWEPPPSPAAWWALSALLALIIVPLGWLRPPAGPAGRQASGPGIGRSVGVPAMGLAAILGGSAALVYVIARELDAGNTAPAAIAGGIWATELWPAISGLAALAAGALALTRRASAEFALALGGAGLAMFGGIVNAAVFFRSVAPVPWGDTAARLLVIAAIGIGAGVAGAASLALRRQAPQKGQDVPA